MEKSINQLYKEMGGSSKGRFADFLAWYSEPKFLQTQTENKPSMEKTTTNPSNAADKKILGMKHKTFCYVAVTAGIVALSYGLYLMYGNSKN
ncbi:MAG: hypothetical protein FGM31_05350 [Candidatus Methylopumilus sp.]|nr:hypothetical protein [Candidatus Methylopumilus sp.]